MQYDFGFKVRPTLRLSTVQKILRDCRAFDEVPSRPYLIGLIEEGVLEGKRSDFGYLIFEDSFNNWVASQNVGA